MNLFKKKRRLDNIPKTTTLQARAKKFHSLNSLFGPEITSTTQNKIYRKIRKFIPIVDAAFEKIEKITGSFKFCCKLY